MGYQKMIREVLARSGKVGVNPRHVEAWMRVEYPTLDAMSAGRFVDEVIVAADCVAHAGPAESEALAASFGL